MELEITFRYKTMHTPEYMYIKMDAHDQLLLSEGACRQLDILTYHPNIQVRQREVAAVIADTEASAFSQCTPCTEGTGAISTGCIGRSVS